MLILNDEANKYNDGTEQPIELPPVEPKNFFELDEEGKPKKFVPKFLAQTIEQIYTFFSIREAGAKSQIGRYHPDRGFWTQDGESIIRETARKYLDTYATRFRIEETIAEIRERHFIESKRLEPNPTKLVVSNGVLNLKTFELEAFDPELYALNALPVTYDSNADCPKIKKFLSEVTPDILTIQEWAGYHLVKHYKHAKASVLVGTGRNGKGTFIQLLETFLGEENTCAVSLIDLTSDRFAKAQLFGKLANLAADIGRGELKRTQVFKWMTGGEPIEAQFKYGSRFKFKNYAKLTFATNELPPTPDLSDAFFERWLPFEFPYQFLGADANKNLLEELTTEAELSGLLNWALDGLKRLEEQNDFTPTGAQKEIRTTWERLSDPTSAFIQHCTSTGNIEHFETKETVRAAYLFFCQSEEFKPLSERIFTEKLRTKLPQVGEEKKSIGKIRKNCWTNLRLNCNSDVLEGGCQACPACQGSLITLSAWRRAELYRNKIYPTLDTLATLDIIQQIEQMISKSKGVLFEEIFERLRPQKISRDKLAEYLSRLTGKGTIIQDPDRKYRHVLALAPPNPVKQEGKEAPAELPPVVWAVLLPHIGALERVTESELVLDKTNRVEYKIVRQCLNYLETVGKLHRRINAQETVFIKTPKWGN